MDMLNIDLKDRVEALLRDLKSSSASGETRRAGRRI